MKNNKMILYILMVVIIFLVACNSNVTRESIYSTSYQNKEYIINTENQTISDNNDTYKYEINNNQIKIIYPNNATYWRQYQNNMEVGGWSNNYDESKYVAGDVLIDVLSYESSNTGEVKNIFLIILLFIIGIWNVASPRSSWYISYGWRFKDAEPSDIALWVTKFGGIVAIIVSLVLIFF